MRSKIVSLVFRPVVRVLFFRCNEKEKKFYHEGHEEHEENGHRCFSLSGAAALNKIRN